MKNKKVIIILLIISCLILKLIGQEEDTTLQIYKLEIEKDFEEYSKYVDSLILDWYNQYNFFSSDLTQPEQDTDSSYIPYFSDDIIKFQLDKMNSYIEMTFNNITKNYIYLYAYKKRKFVSYLLGLSEYYFPYFEEALDRYGLPLELKYLPIIESALNPRAVSRAKAVGLWQFILSTGKLCGLKVNSFVDERMDPIKSSDAAARYLRDLYNIFNDWHLALAAYNCGPLNVQKAIRRSGKTTFWGIYRYLPRETRGYVPAFIGAAYTFHYYNELKITPKKLMIPQKVDTIFVKKWTHFKQISEVLNIRYELIKFLNPQYKKDIIPASNDNKLPLILPIENIMSFIALEDSIYKYKDSLFFASIKPSSYSNYSFFDEEAIIHRVKKGETIYSIAKRYGVKVSDIREWNNLKSNYLKPNKRIVIYVMKKKPENKFISTVNSDTTLTSVKDTIHVIDTTSIVIRKNINESKKSEERIIYTVKKGDTLYSISSKFNVSISELCEKNNIKSINKIKVGQKLIIR
ncbi:MAG: LysM peptidoglycan-binding domain-containing protein [Bacteroidales bacterium]|nr:LysM peptidoglycan-binding domain-containing protein [Bacteroidales bacterium]